MAKTLFHCDVTRAKISGRFLVPRAGVALTPHPLSRWLFMCRRASPGKFSKFYVIVSQNKLSERYAIHLFYDRAPVRRLLQSMKIFGVTRLGTVGVCLPGES